MTHSGKDPVSLRERIFKRDSFRCVYCGVVKLPAELTLDHVQPKMRGGDRSEGNLVTACTPCNTEKAGSPAWAYLAERPEKRANFLRYAAEIWPRHRRAIVDAVRDSGRP